MTWNNQCCLTILIFFVNKFNSNILFGLTLTSHYKTNFKVMGKFGANSKLTEMITIEPDKDDLVERIDGQKMNQINVDFSHLAHCCLPNDLRNNSYSNKPDLISTSDIRIKVEDTYYFNAHKVLMVFHVNN